MPGQLQDVDHHGLAVEAEAPLFPESPGEQLPVGTGVVHLGGDLDVAMAKVQQALEEEPVELSGDPGPAQFRFKGAEEGLCGDLVPGVTAG